jgi:hypothetical protein
MECYRRALIGEQTFEGRAENLAQAGKLSRTYAVLLDALNRHRGTRATRRQNKSCGAIPGRWLRSKQSRFIRSLDANERTRRFRCPVAAV